jgi:hypothetical protein
MANGLLDYLSGFGSTPPEYLGGLLGQDAVDKLKSRAATTGIANAVLGYLAAPKNQNLGLGRIIGQSLQAGMQGAQGVYDNATQDYMAQQKIAEMQRQQKQQAAQDLFRSRIGQPNASRDVVTQETAQVPVAQGTEAPSFQTQLPAPTVTKQQYFDPKVMMNEALQSGALPFDKYLELTAKQKEESPFAKIDPSKYTQESINKFNATGVYGDLVPFKEAPSMTEEPSRVAYALYGKALNQLTPQQVGQVNNYIEQSKVRITGAGVPSQQPGFKDATTLRQEYKSDPVLKTFNEIDSAYKIIKTTMTKPSAAGDLAGVTKFMKLLDPASVVRESEVGMAKNATGLYDKLSNYYASISQGVSLSPNQRADFLRTATEFYNIAKEQKESVAKQYGDIAEAGGLSRVLVVGTPSSKNVLNYDSQGNLIR